jgi:F-box interacting protein
MEETPTTTAKRQLITLIRTLTSPPLPTLPFDLIAEILCRLPVKLLLQLRCLCKSFNTLISDPKFTKKHLHISTMRHHLITDSKDMSYVMSYPLNSIFKPVTTNATRLHLPFKQELYSIVGSCHGILCLVVNEGSVILWNPSIRKFTKLPSLKSPIKVSYIRYGFGYDPLIDNYKVVAVFCYDSGNEILEAKTNVYTLGTNSWRMIEGNFPVPKDGLRKLTYVSGTLNWYVYTDDDLCVVSFDLVNESHRKLLPPNFGGEDRYHVVLGVLRDCLCITTSSRAFYSVWLMKEYGNEKSWIKLFCVSYMEQNPYFYRHSKPIWISKDDQMLMESKSRRKGIMYLVVYSYKSGTSNSPMIGNITSTTREWNTPEVYAESLVSPCF